MRISDLSSDVCSSDLVVRDDAEAEDVVQEAYTHAFAGLSTFRGESSLSTWLTRIVLNEANGRLRRRRPSVDIATFEATPQEDSRVVSFPNRFGSEDPAAAAARAQNRGLLEHAIDELPDAFRPVFVMRSEERRVGKDWVSTCRTRWS